MSEEISAPRKITVRKAPRQQRSRAKVEKILAAATQCLVKEGIDSLTTNHIARLAELSVGSLYQYFPNKQAILNELYTRWLQDMRTKLAQFDSDRSNHRDPFELLSEIMESTYGPRSYKDDGKFEQELMKGMALYPELKDVDEMHEQMIADSLVRILCRVGLTASEEEKKHLGAYLYGLANLYDEMVNDDGGNQELVYQWTQDAARSILLPYFPDLNQ